MRSDDPTPTPLTPEQQRWCAARNIGTGYDDDNPDLHQFQHLVEPTGERRPFIDSTGDYEVEAALCRSPRLWFGEGRGHIWPWTATEENWPFALPVSDESRERISTTWSAPDCPHCLRLLFERGCPR